MTIFSHVLKAFFVVIFLLLFYIGTGTYMPCTFYPLAYRQALAIDDSIQPFKHKFGRLPDLSNETDVRALNLAPGYFMTPLDRGKSQSITVIPEGSRDITYTVNQAMQPGFDTPWVDYNLTERSILCGHR